MDKVDGNGGSKRLSVDTSKLYHSVQALRNSPFRVATLFLALLCAILVAAVIGQAINNSKVGKHHENTIEAARKENEILQSKLKTVQNMKKDLEVNHEHLQSSYNYMSKSTNKIQSNSNLLTEEVNKLKQSQSNLQVSNAALSKEREQLKASKAQLQTTNKALSTAKDLLKTQIELMTKSRNVLEISYHSVTNERDNLQNKYNNVTGSKEQLQMTYNNQIKKIEHLRENYRSSSSDRDSIASSHQNLTVETANLQNTYATLANGTNNLMATYNSAILEKKAIEIRLKNLTAERDLDKVKITNMGAEINKLRIEVSTLNATLKATPNKVCPSGWKKFETSCYLTSTSKKTWYLSRNNCQSKGADLVIINSNDEKEFVNGLLSGATEGWIGLTDDGVEGHWKWVDGTPLTLSFWADDQPNSFDGDQDCVEFWHRSSGGKWNDSKCSSKKHWVCELYYENQLLRIYVIPTIARAKARMTVKYQTSTETTMDIDDGNHGFKHLLLGGSKFQYSVYALRNSPVRITTLLLGLLCIVLVAGLIGQCVHYRKVDIDNQNKLVAIRGERDNLQSNLKTAQNDKKNIEVTHEHLQQSYNFMSKSGAQMNTKNRLLSDQVTELKQSESTLQASNDALGKELDELKASKEQLQTDNEALSTAKDSFQTSYDSILKSKNDLQVNYNSLTKERDNFQNKYNNATRAKEQLQNDYNSLIKDVEHLEERYHASSSERDKIANSHQNLTLEKENLQATYTTLAKAADKLLVSYNNVIEEKKNLESALEHVTAERELQSVEIRNMTSELSQLRDTVTRLNATAKVCPSGWQKFESSCYFKSSSKKTWYLSRDYCKGKGAHLVIINSREEMKFVNNLSSSNGEIWLGLTDEGVEGQWKWVDGTPMTLQFWADGQPNSYSGNQDCGEYWYRSSGVSEWNDEKCSAQRYWVCEK
ncbi:uncharacterized protein LOC144197789 [Stigmatopora nigra]